jgi:hypothetical protein
LVPTAGGFAESLYGLGVTGVNPGVLGEVIYSDYSDTGGVFRSQTVGIYETLLAHYRELGLRVAVAGGNAYAVPYAERVYGTPLSSGVFDIFGDDVPFYQIVFQGWTTMTTPPLMQSVQPEIAFLKAVETGMELLYTGIYAEPSALLYTRFEHLYSSTVSLWIDRAAAQVTRYAPLQQLIYDREITGHRLVSPGVSLTVFENGVHVLVNFSDTEFMGLGKNLPAMDFVWWRG